MSIASDLLAELDQEMPSTRRLLARVPSDKGTWKPHTKSMPLGHLAQLVAGIPGWIDQTIGKPSLDLAKGAKYSFEPTEKILAQFDEAVAKGRKALEGATDADFAKPWNLVMGEKVLMTGVVGPVVRMHINHLVHHRGQLTVYLRLLDVPIPSIYGPTADEPM